MTLNGTGGQRMFDYTSQNVGKPMAVVYIERIPEVKVVDGKEVRSTRTTEQVINAATIQGVFGKQFQTTGLESPQVAQDLALLLRAGSLAAPMDFVEERIVGPSLGAENVAARHHGGAVLVPVRAGVLPRLLPHVRRDHLRSRCC